MEGDVKKGQPEYYIPKMIDGEFIPIDIGERLVQPSMSINELGKKLLKASMEGNVDDIKTLMNKGAPFTADWLGTSPLHFASQNNHLNVCEILLRAGISKDARTKVDRTPLHIAAYEGHLEIVKCLLRNKADIDCKDLLAMTPLHWAVQNCHTDVVSLLVHQGAQIDVRNKFDLLPIDIALQCNRPDIVEILSTAPHEPELATQTLVNEMENSSDSVVCPSVDTLQTNQNSPIPLETVLFEDIDSENSIDPERLYINHEETEISIGNIKSKEIPKPKSEIQVQEHNNFSESMKLLQQHGITMLPADDTNILSSIIESGHSVVLTEAGKQALNAVRPEIENTIPTVTKVPTTPTIKSVGTLVKGKNFITVTPREFLAMTLNQGDVLKQIGKKFVSVPKPAVKRIVMKKNKIIPVTSSPNVVKIQKSNINVEYLMKQLLEANKRVEEYKQKLLKKEAEAEGYKQQLLLIASKSKIFID